MFTLALLAILQVQGVDGPRTLRVGAEEEFTSPAAALAAARPGDTVILAAGVHPGRLRIDRRVVVRGEPGAVLDGGGTGTVITVEADSVALIGLRIRGSGRSLDHDDAAIKLVRCTGCRVLENEISEPLHGIYLLESHGIELRGNRIVGDPAIPEARRGNGIHLFHSTAVRIRENSIRGTRDGMYFSFSRDNLIQDNDVSGVRYGLHYMYSDANVFERNRFTRNAAGAAIMFSSDIVFRENTFAEHVGYRAYGILLQTAYRVTAERNRIEGNLVGIFLDMSEDNLFRENRIAGNGIGIDMIASAERNTFVGNSITGNRTAVRKPYGDARNEWAVDGRGNHWGDPRVFDLDGDGVGDRPYEASDPFASLAGSRPALEIFIATPAALALSWAERALPVFDLPGVTDPAPLVAPPANVPRQDGARANSASRGRRGLLALLPLMALALALGRRSQRGSTA
jgi:nitrous oxidase accessory protein